MWIFDSFPFLQHFQIGWYLILDVEGEDAEKELIAFLFLADPVLSRCYSFEEGVILAYLFLLFGFRLTHSMLYKIIGSIKDNRQLCFKHFLDDGLH